MDKVNGYTAVPNWFMKVTGVCVTLLTLTFIPWSIWTTKTLFEFQTLGVQVERNTRDLDNVAAEQSRRTANVYRVESLEAMNERTSVQLDAIRMQLQQLREALVKLEAAVERDGG